MDLPSLKRVLRLVELHLPPAFDRESIAMDILVESWTNHLPFPSYGFILQRCIDQMRKRSLERKAITMNKEPKNGDVNLDPLLEHDQQDQALVEKLVGVLSNTEKKLIAYRFYMDIPVTAIAKELKMPVETVGQTIQMALFKMREAGE